LAVLVPLYDDEIRPAERSRPAHAGHAELDLLEEIFGGGSSGTALRTSCGNGGRSAPYRNPNFFISSSNRGSCLRESAPGSTKRFTRFAGCSAYALSR